MLPLGERISPAAAAESAGRFAGFRPVAVIGRLLRIVSKLLSAPVALAEFTDPRFRWARAFVGEVAGWKGEELAACGHLAAAAGPLAVEELTADARFQGCSLELGGRPLRSCASVPVVRAGGDAIGWLAVFDFQPGRWRVADLAALEEAAALVGELLDWIASGVAPSAETGLLTAEHRLRTLFENTTDLIYIQNLRGEITAVNSAAERLLGFQREELLGRSVASLVAPEHEPKAAQMALIQFGGSGPQSFRLKFRARDGRLVPLEVSTHLLFEQGMPVGLIAFGRFRSRISPPRAVRTELDARIAEIRTSGARLAPALVEFEGALRRALDNDELELRFQPILTVAGDLYGLEALLAWRHPSGKLVSAEQFVRVAEDTGVVSPLGTRVMERACRLAAGWQRHYGRRLRLAVNVSALQFGEPDFARLVAATLERAGLEPAQLELEVTESALMRNLAASIESMAEVRRLGVRISIDDFGTGYSSLSYLHRLPADTLKLDRSFLRLSDAPEAAVSLLHGIVTLARSLGLVIAAEGIETPAQLELARRAGFDLVQGHLLGRPMTEATIRRYLRRQASSR